MEKERNITYNYCFEDTFSEEDIEARRLYLNGEIDGNVINSIAYYIMRYNRIDKEIPIEERKPIILYINSPGGSVPDGYGVIDTMLLSDTPIYTVNIGQCMSMGFLIYLAGDKRYAMPHSEFLMHDGSTMGWDSTAKMKDKIEFETGQLERMTKEYIISRTDINDDLYEKKYRIEWYFLPEEGKKIGAVDYIVGKDCKYSEII